MVAVSKLWNAFESLRLLLSGVNYFLLFTVKPVLFACPLFREFRDLATSLIYILAAVSLSSVSTDAKIKGAKIIYWIWTPKLRATKIKGSTVPIFIFCAYSTMEV